jgi:hypothetical protein
LLSAIREQNKMFHGMVVAQAQKVEIEGNAVAFTFAAVHRHLKSQLEARRGWIEQLSQQVVGRRLSVVAYELPPVAAEPEPKVDARRADLEARVKSEPAVQAVLDVFGGEIAEIEEL